MDPPELRDAKRAMRARIRAIRDGLSPAERARASAEVVRRLRAFLPPSPSAVSSFAAIGAELDLSGFDAVAAALGHVLFYPRVEGDRIAFRRADRSALAPGTWGIPEPPPDAPEAGALDLMIVPGVAFDPACRRLGNGKAYYDRAIAALRPARTVGVCYHAQLVDEVPAGPHDAVVDVLLTERVEIAPRPGAKDV